MNSTIKKLENQIERLESAIRLIAESKPQELEKRIKQATKLLK